jgi:hypothetical protein
MSFLRFLAFLALGFWIGGLVALGGIAASTLFAVLTAHDPVAGRELAGLAFGAIFQRFQYAAWVAGGVMLISLGFRRALGPRPRWFGLRMWIVVGMLVASVGTVLLITPRIESIRTSVSGPVANLPDQDPRKIAFGRWHGLSSGLMLMTIVVGVGLFWTEIQDAH